MGRLYAFSPGDEKSIAENIRPAPAAALFRHTSAGATGRETSLALKEKYRSMANAN
ncbi:hypothetical protein BN2475_420099 [Paraburkholderia ribeironis]|uniref:Uncharacterized protein n=1 Tax=Paraburkholderia ribeironis TaxID=1247936 RepID=A0A1N7S7P6_9BURK|nr:hypothetical protein BN2475_420099 [Paraburkholderia ribeironis]